ncbi:MAG: iaaH [Rhodospirillales bacterium]|nr:iaaH [Rhodospirillales bacterium]
MIAEVDAAALTTTEAASLIRSGGLGAEDYAAALLARAERLDDLNAIIAIDRQAVLAAAREVDLSRRRDASSLGPLAGIPLLVKDNIDTASLPTTAGCRGLAGNWPRRNAAVLDSLLGAGALVFAKANMHELAMGITNNNGSFGAVRNPYDRHMIPGGSSGGTAAGIAARIAPAGLGSDTGGSVRIPASLCGIAGLRPTVRRYAGAGVVPLSHTRDTIGPMARTVADVALLDAVITGTAVPAPARLAGLRLGLVRDPYWRELDGETDAVMREALERLTSLGVVLVEADLPELYMLQAQVGLGMTRYETIIDLLSYLAEAANGITLDEVASGIGSPDVAASLRAARGDAAPTAAVYDTTMKILRPRLQRLYAEYFIVHRVDAIVLPTTPLPARPIGEDETVRLNGREVPTFQTFIRNTACGSTAGIPGLSLPAGLTRSGLPVGLGLDGAAGSDKLLLSIALAIEAEFGPLPAPTI